MQQDVHKRQDGFLIKMERPSLRRALGPALVKGLLGTKTMGSGRLLCTAPPHSEALHHVFLEEPFLMI